MQMASRLGGSNCNKKQLAISLSSFSVSKSNSENNQNKEEQEQDNEKREVEFKWLRYKNDSNAMHCDFCQQAGR